MDIFKLFKTEVENLLGKKIKVVKFECGGEYYGIIDVSREQFLRPFAYTLLNVVQSLNIPCLVKAHQNGIFA